MYVGISAGKFDELVASGRMPGPRRIDELRIWDMERLDEILTLNQRLRGLENLHWFGMLPPEVNESVYVIGFHDYVKIGYSTSTRERIANLQTGVPEPLTVYGIIPNAGVSIEKALHARFSEYRMEGEWFRKTGKLASWMKKGCKL